MQELPLTPKSDEGVHIRRWSDSTTAWLLVAVVVVIAAAALAAGLLA